MAEIEPGVDRHEWESEYAALEEDLATDPEQALPEFLDLVERMAKAQGFPLDGDIAEQAPEVEGPINLARELVQRLDAGRPMENDDLFHAAAELRSLYRSLVEEPGAPGEILEQSEEASREDR